MKQIFTWMVAVAVCASCTRENIGDIPHDKSPSETGNLLGKKLENPYSLGNMRRALANLSPATRSGLGEADIQATHYYVKFMPETEEELDLLKQDTTVILYEYPLDYELGEGFEGSYHDPAVPDSLPTYQYASISVGHWAEVSRTPVQYEILEELFIPDEDKDDGTAVATRSGTAAPLNEALADALVEEALRITGNDQEEEVQTRGRSKWRPAGRLTVYDNLAGQIPLKGAKVRARRWFTTHKGYTDSRGYYSCDGRFKRQANYSIVWENSRWDIRSGWFGQASYDGPKQKGNWNLYISGGKSLKYATIHRAAYRYYYENIGGFARPANSKREKICYLDKEGTGDFWGNVGLGVLPDIRIYGKDPDSGEYKATDKIFGTTIHELAHVSHCTWLNKIQYWQVSKIIYESWAECVEWAITKLEYEALGKTVSVNDHQNWPKKSRDLAYSSIFIDLVDTYNQGKNDTDLPYDEVSGYSYSVLNVLLLDSYGLSSLKKNVKKWRPYNVTNEQIDKLFEKYEETKWK